MTKTLLLVCVLACAVPASASAASLSLTTPPDSTYSPPRPTVTVTASGTADQIPPGQSGQHVTILQDETGEACAPTVAAEEQRQTDLHQGVDPTYVEPLPGPFSQQVTVDMPDVGSPSHWKLCGYIGGPDDNAQPAAAASTGTFTLTNPKAPTGANRAGFEFVVPKPRSAKPTMTLRPGDQLWLGGSFAYEVNPFACAGPDNRLYWFSDAFEGSNHRSHGAPAVLGQTDSMSGLTLKWRLSKHLKPGKYAIQMACADGSLATGKRILTIAGPSRHHAKKKHRK